ncbi:MAG: TadE/TadG family type IV pilus assembly protein [Phycisphaeraceae bacterium]
MANSSLLTLADGWLANALSDRFTLVCGGIAVVCAILLVLLLRAMMRMGRIQKMADRVRDLHRDQSATTTIEFALCFPILLTIILVLVQSMLLMAGNMYVHYAAFQATRAASIEIGQDYTANGDLAPNLYTNDKYSLKYERIHRAAAYAILPVAGQFETGTGKAGEMVAALQNHYAAYGVSEPAWVASMLSGKVHYADAMTEIEVLETRVMDEHDVTFEPLPDNPYRFGPRDAVTVRLTHKLNLGVPIASRIFADGDHDGKGPGRYTLVSAQYTLANEGVPVPLPEKPEIDRVTPALPRALPNDPLDTNGGRRPRIQPNAGTSAPQGQ